MSVNCPSISRVAKVTQYLAHSRMVLLQMRLQWMEVEVTENASWVVENAGRVTCQYYSKTNMGDWQTLWRNCQMNSTRKRSPTWKVGTKWKIGRPAHISQHISTSLAVIIFAMRGAYQIQYLYSQNSFDPWNFSGVPSLPRAHDVQDLF